MMLGQGRAAAIDNNDIAALAIELKCHPADLEAIAEVESNGFGWFPDGRMKILNEKHWFYKLIDPAKRDKAVNAGLARKNWISPKKGGYADQATADQRYAVLKAAIALDEEAAFQSISMGRFQIMGFNYHLCGFTSAKNMWVEFLDDEANQLKAFANFLIGKKLVPAIQAGNFETVETVYNGGGLEGVYAKKMREAAQRLRAGKWRQWPGNWPGRELSSEKPKIILAAAPVEPLPAPKPGLTPIQANAQGGNAPALATDAGDKRNVPSAPISAAPSVPVHDTPPPPEHWVTTLLRNIAALLTNRNKQEF
jgi:hypothetical protein